MNAESVICEGCGGTGSMKAKGDHMYECSLCGYTVAAGIPDAVQSVPNRASVQAVKIISPEFEYKIKNERVTITRYKGKRTRVQIPACLQGFPVRVIGSEAFRGAQITEVIFSDEVEYVEDRAFFDCHSLSTVKGGAGLIRFGEYAFGGCYMLGRIDLQQDADAQFSTFAGCFNLEIEPEHVLFPNR